jgi:membrane-associated protease RseP (regulator of RpoE activity)
MRHITLISITLLLVTGLWAKSNGGGEGYGFGFSSDESGGSYLGVDTRDVTTDRLGTLKLKDEKGVEVTMVDQDAPAGKAGVKEHDVILSLNGTEVESVEQLRRMIHEVPPGRVVTLGLSRNGQPLSVRVQLADRKKSFSYSSNDHSYSYSYEMPPIPPIPPIPPMPDIDIPMSIVVVHSSQRSGLLLENLTPQLGDYFGTKNGEGVLVRSVEKGTAAEKAGFRAGDVIIKVNGQRISDASDFSHTLQSRKDNTVSVSVIRDRKEQTITLTIPSRRQSEIYQETFEAPEIDAETQRGMLEAQTEIARAKPEMEMATREVERMKPELARAQRELSREQERMRKDLRKMQEDLRKQQRQMEEKLRLEVRGDWTRI